MASLIKATICLSDIPKDRIFTAESGKKYLTCEVRERKNGADQFGNTHTIAISIKNDDGTYDKVYIGKGKTQTFGNGQPSQAQPAPAYSAPSKPASNNDDIPF